MKQILLLITMFSLLPLAMNAQSDGYFRNEKSLDNRASEINLGGDGSFNFGSAPQQENPTPVGGGLLIMVAAGAGYALMKKKEAAK